MIDIVELIGNDSECISNDSRCIINDIGCNHILTVIDACYSGSFLKYRSGGDERPGKLSDREKLINDNILFLICSIEHPHITSFFDHLDY